MKIRIVPMLGIAALGVLAYRVMLLEARVDAMERELDARFPILRYGVEQPSLTKRIRDVERALAGELPVPEGSPSFAEWLEE